MVLHSVEYLVYWKAVNLVVNLVAQTDLLRAGWMAATTVVQLVLQWADWKAVRLVVCLVAC